MCSSCYGINCVKQTMLFIWWLLVAQKTLASHDTMIASMILAMEERNLRMCHKLVLIYTSQTQHALSKSRLHHVMTSTTFTVVLFAKIYNDCIYRALHNYWHPRVIIYDKYHTEYVFKDNQKWAWPNSEGCIVCFLLRLFLNLSYHFCLPDHDIFL